ncbi:MAG: hypothetical protein MRJ92_10000 [Nitrospira sp.]|nr:hypothetical protein [Nitrospira sp.]
MVVAAGNPAAIGTQLHDAALDERAQQPEQRHRLRHGKGRPAVIVVEPIRRDNRIAGWVRLAVAAPPDAAAPRSEDDLALDVALVIVPLLPSCLHLDPDYERPHEPGAETSRPHPTRSSGAAATAASSDRLDTPSQGGVV